MARQLRDRARFLAPLTALTAALALGVGCSGEPPQPGITFTPDVVDLGRFHAGETLTVEFPFAVHGEAVEITRLEEQCGCLAPVLLVDGRALPPRPQEQGGGWRLEPGTAGVVQVAYATAGYRGRKQTGVVVHGSGRGLPARLLIDSWLDGWFEVEPEVLRFGALDGRQDHMVEFTVRGEEPFRVTELLGGAAPLQVEGLPSPAAARAQKVRVLLPARPEEVGLRAAFLNFGTDVGRSFRVAAEWEWVPEVQVTPWPRLMLRSLDPAAATFAAVEVAASRGRIEGLEAVLDGPEGATAELVEEVPGLRYRVKLSLPAGLPPGALKAELRLRGLHQRDDGSSEALDRVLPILGIVPEA